MGGLPQEDQEPGGSPLSLPPQGRVQACFQGPLFSVKYGTYIHTCEALLLFRGPPLMLRLGRHSIVEVASYIYLIDRHRHRVLVG